MRVETIRRGALTVAAFALLTAAVNAQETPELTVCRELQGQYATLARAHEERDADAILALKARFFSAVGPKGRTSTFEDVEQYTRRLVGEIKPPIKLQNTILRLTVQGDIAIAEVLQEFSRRQKVGESERTLDTSVIQRERWRRTPDGWRQTFVDDVHDSRWLVDGKRVDPSKPFDPDAPEFKPEDPPRPEKTTDCGLSKPAVAKPQG